MTISEDHVSLTSRRQALAKNPAAIAFLTACKWSIKSQLLFFEQYSLNTYKLHTAKEKQMF